VWGEEVESEIGREGEREREGSVLFVKTAVLGLYGVEGRGGE
jgi:hypothetical protein